MFNFLSGMLQSMLPSGLVGNSTRSKQNALLRILALSHSQRLDPKTLIRNLAAEHPGRYGKKLMMLQRWIAADSSMSAALAHTPGVLDEDDTLAIQCAIETQTLDETFAFLLERSDDAGQAAAGEIIRGMLGYVLGVLCFAMLVASFLMIFIVPTFEQIFEEFAMELPPLMLALVKFSNTFAAAFPIALLVVLGACILMLFEDVRRGIRFSPLGRLLPTTAERRSAGLLRLLAVPTKQGTPIAPTVTAAAQFHPDRRTRKRLLRARTDARTDAQTDADIWIQLASQGLISRNQADQINKIRSPSLRGWTLDTLAVKQRRHAYQKAESMARVLQHVPILVLGLLVGWITIAVMHTLTSLVTSLA
ncbi:type II secretion system F family protein [Stieleria sp. ICT_E10.1]|uniref:type II secretion system F family protein n=1 Tax=Stieleria sedimenti TaxID=2976331 RepID=UPI00217FACE7|nr:type II secretion system F family protein [Stieleria sedimenti]MCS7468850.1 type II secretion system F family protein [Stieleria sedimenti]